jgi:hypothetical protein
VIVCMTMLHLYVMVASYAMLVCCTHVLVQILAGNLCTKICRCMRLLVHDFHRCGLVWLVVRNERQCLFCEMSYLLVDLIEFAGCRHLLASSRVIDFTGL